MNNNEPQKNNDSTLNPIKIGDLPKAKGRKTSLIMFVFIMILLAVVYFLPDIDRFIRGENVDSYKDDISSVVNIPNTKMDFFAISPLSKISIDNHTFSGFKINQEKNTLDYLVTNFNEERSIINNKDWYIRLYDEDKKLIDYFEVIGPLLTSEVDYDLSIDLKNNYESVPKYLKIGVVNKNEYPDVSLKNDEMGNYYLTCTKGGSKLIYYFNDNKLYKISEYYNASKQSEGEEYDILFDIYEKKSSNLTNSENFSSSFTDRFSRFEFEANIDLTNSSYSNYDDNYLVKNTDSKETNFIIESRGYDCE